LILISKHNNKVEKHLINCKEGDILLDVINEEGIPDISVFGVCNKQLACHSCSVHIIDKYNLLEKPSEEELDVHCELGEVYRENCTRMSCQIKIKKELDGMTIEIPRSAFFLLNDEHDNKNKDEIKKLN
jgi:2Fe-2S ferredoxin